MKQKDVHKGKKMSIAEQRNHGDSVKVGKTKEEYGGNGFRWSD